MQGAVKTSIAVCPTKDEFTDYTKPTALRSGRKSTLDQQSLDSNQNWLSQQALKLSLIQRKGF